MAERRHEARHSAEETQAEQFVTVMRDSSDSASSGSGAWWLVMTNRLAEKVLVFLGLGIAGVGLYLGIFGWLNDGPAAGVGIILLTAGFGLAFVAGGFCFRVIANAHAAKSSRRWWLQVLLPTAAYIAFGLAAMFSSFLEDLVR